MSYPGITVHTIVRNEDRFIWYSLVSILDFVDKILIFDTGSTDNTVKIIKSIASSKIIFEQKGLVDAKSLVSLRQEQIDRTQTTWFYLLDGDEIYPRQTITKVTHAINHAKKNMVGLYLPFYNLVGDVYHTQQQKYGHYNIGKFTGHINLRGIKKFSGLHLIGEYPLETYTNKSGLPIQNYPQSQLICLSTPFFHAGSLTRSSSPSPVLTRKIVYDWGVSITTTIPEVFFMSRPGLVPSVIQKRSLRYVFSSFFISILRQIKYYVQKFITA